MGVANAKITEWEDATAAAMRTTMDDIFGANSTKALVYHLEDRGITIEEGVKRPKDLIAALSDIFGAGAKALEMALVNEVGEAAGINTKGMSLDQALSKARSILKNPRH